MTGKPVSATVITGFLGAGKTTLLRRILTARQDQKIALLINEFGDVGIDAAVLSDIGEIVDDGCGCPALRRDDIIELANGCICCTVADDFLPAMQTLLTQDTPPDHIIIETSGLALPQPLVQAFSWPDIRTKTRLDGVVAMVDGPALLAGQFTADDDALAAQRENDQALDHETSLHDLFSDQIDAANLILISKSDMMTPAQIDKVITQLREQLTHDTPIIAVQADSASVPVVLGLGLEEEAFARAHHHHHDDHEHDDHDHDAFESFILKISNIIDADSFLRKLSNSCAAYGLLRAKGLMQIADKPLPFIVQAVGRRVDSYFGRSWPEGVSENMLVVITHKGVDKQAIADSLDGKLCSISGGDTS